MDKKESNKKTITRKKGRKSSRSVKRHLIIRPRKKITELDKDEFIPKPKIKIGGEDDE